MNNSQPKSSTPLEVFAIPAILGAALLLVLISSWVIGFISSVSGGWLHRPVAAYGFATVCTLVSLWLVLGPVFAYLNIGQAKKIEIITGFYSPDTIADYFDQFWTGRNGIRALVKAYREADSSHKYGIGLQLEQKLRDLFSDDFGLRVYVIPIILLVSAGGIALFFAYTGGIGLTLSLLTGHPSPVQPLGITLDVVSIAAIFGAYTWVTSDVIVRNHLWTLHPSDLSWYALRFIVAVPLGQAIAVTIDKASGGAVPDGAGAFLAFVANLFSLDAITTALGTAATRFGVQMTTSNNERDDLIAKLAGVDDEKARALNVEGVSTIAQLTTVDPIRTSIRSGLPFEFVLNLVDEALLWAFVGDSIKPMRLLGLRGASDVLALEAAWQASDATAIALTILQQTDSAVGQAQASLTAAQTANPIDRAAVATAQQVVMDAVAKRALALTAFLTAASSEPSADRVAMMTALSTTIADGGPGLTVVGFNTIADRLRSNSYAVFVKKLLES